jgi:hypothetical protein
VIWDCYFAAMRLGARALAAALCSVVLVGTSHVAAPAAAKPVKDPDGKYSGEEVPPPDNAIDQVFITFKVTGDGRKIKNWIVTMNVVCVSYPVYVEAISQSMPTMKVKKNGRFHKVFETTVDGSEARIEVGGKLVGTKVKDGILSYEVGVCQRGNDPGDPMRWTAKRTKR